MSTDRQTVLPPEPSPRVRAERIVRAQLDNLERATEALDVAAGEAAERCVDGSGSKEDAVRAYELRGGVIRAKRAISYLLEWRPQ